MAQDLALLLREHIRKEDGVINPLLERLLWEGVRS
jgi:hemerythrin-like domain-containing protein